MQVTVTTYGQPREVLGDKSVERDVDDGATVGDVFAEMVEEYPDLEDALFGRDGEVQAGTNVAKNGTAIENDAGLDTPVADGDELRVAQSLRGG